MKDLLPKAKAAITKDMPLSTDEAIFELQKLGRVHLYQYDDGDWAATVTFFLPFADSKFEVKAGGCKDRQLTVNNAVNALYIKAMDAKRKMSEA